MSHSRLIAFAATSASFAALTLFLYHRVPSTRRAAPPPDTRLPLTFEPNQGQAPADVEFIARASGLTLELSRATATMAVDSGAVSVLLVGARSDAAAEGVERRSGTVNYFLGNDPSRWVTDVPTYGQVRYRDVYPRVDLVFHAAGYEIEYDFVVHPGADPRQIALKVDGLEKVGIDDAGDLVMTLNPSHPPIRHRRPRVFQIVDGVRRDIDGTFEPRADGTIGFSVGPYDSTRALTIDPVIVFASALGGGRDGARAVAVDAQGNTYVAGSAGADFPASPNAPQTTVRAGGDAFIAKVDPTGSRLIYATYLGGNNARTDYEQDPEVASGIAVDAAGNAYVTGQTQSTDFPVVNAFQASAQYNVGKGFDAFVTKVNASGTALLFSTYLGATNGSTFGRAIAVDPIGNAYVAGNTWGSQFPTTTRLGPPGTRLPAFVTKFNHAGGMVYSTTIGGTREWTIARAIAVDGAGQPHVAGETYSADFPIEHGWQTRCPLDQYGSCAAAFLAKLTASGAHLLYSTFLGGEIAPFGERTTAAGVAVDGAGNAVVAGTTSSRAMPTVHALQSSYGGGERDGFVASFTSRGTVRYSTYLGGKGADYGFALAADPHGRAYLAGSTVSPDYPLVDAIAGIAPSGPMFSSADAGESWTTPTRDFVRSITNVAIDPAVPDTMYAAVGYDGVYKSVDGGARWARRSAGLEDSLATQELVVAPADPATLYLATYNRIYKTADGASTWTLIFAQGSGGAVAVDARTADTVYASTTGGGIVKTMDGGRSWRRLGVSAGDAADIAVDPMAPDTVYVASNGSGTDRVRSVFKSTDGGESWTSGVVASPFLGDLAIDPADSSTIYVGGDGVVKSSDGGRTWTRVRSGAAMEVAVAGPPRRAVYAAARDSAAAPCVQRSVDGGATWQSAERGVRRPDNVCAIYTIVVDPRRPARLVAAGPPVALPFLTRLRSDGRIDYSTFLEEGGGAITADLQGNAYVAGARSRFDGTVFRSRFLIQKIAQPQFIHP